MKIDDLGVVVRPRTLFETADLGVVMARTWSSSLFPAWLIVLAVWAALIALIVKNPIWAIVLVWWFKPLMGRCLLFVMSRKMFGVETRLWDTLKALPRIWFRLPFLLSLTLFRFSPNQSLYLPIWMLEGLKGTALNNRLALFRKSLFFDAIGVSIFCFLIEWAILLSSTWGLCRLFLPEAYVEMMPDFGSFVSSWFGFVAYVLVVGMIQPFIVAIFFAMYLNCRSILEGWDLELAFRKLANRIAPSASLLLLFLIASFGGSLQVKAYSRTLSTFALTAQLLAFAQEDLVEAQDDGETHDDSKPVKETKHPERYPEIKKSIHQIYEEPPFKLEKQKVKQWTWRSSKPKKEAEPPPIKPPSFLGNLFSVLTYPLYLMIAVILIALVVFLARAIFKRAQGTAPKSETRETQAPAVLQQLIRPESLPKDILAAAQASFDQGETRQAMSFLFRGCLLFLSKSRQLDIRTVATEGECLRLVQKRLDGEFASFFAVLVAQWQRVAYGHKPLSQEVFHQLCERWALQVGAKL